VDIIEHGTFLTDEQLDTMSRQGTFWFYSSVSEQPQKSACPTVHARAFRKVSEEYVDLLKGPDRAYSACSRCDTTMPLWLKRLKPCSMRTIRRSKRSRSQQRGAELCARDKSSHPWSRSSLTSSLSKEIPENTIVACARCGHIKGGIRQDI